MSKQKRVLDKFDPEIKVYSSEDDFLLQRFNSGEYAFNNYLTKEAAIDKVNGDGVTYLVFDKKEDDEKEIVAYYTISASTIHIKDRLDYEDDGIPESEKREHFSPISAFMINMFAVNTCYQDTLYNDNLIADLVLQNVIHDLFNMSKNVVGAKIITLCSVLDAIGFYKRNKFKEFDDKITIFDKVDAMDNTPMSFPMHKITNQLM